MLITGFKKVVCPLLHFQTPIYKPYIEVGGDNIYHSSFLWLCLQANWYRQPSTIPIPLWMCNKFSFLSFWPLILLKDSKILTKWNNFWARVKNKEIWRQIQSPLTYWKTTLLSHPYLLGIRGTKGIKSCFTATLWKPVSPGELSFYESILPATQKTIFKLEVFP